MLVEYASFVGLIVLFNVIHVFMFTGGHVMRCFICIVVFLLLVLPHSSVAEFYKYRDKNGVVRYTDNPLDIPKDQQNSATAYQEIKVIEAAGETADLESVDSIEKTLRAEKEILDKEYEGLVAERKVLEDAAKIPRSEDEIAAFEKKILDFNLRLKQYEDKRLVFKQKADAYNERRKAEFE